MAIVAIVAMLNAESPNFSIFQDVYDSVVFYWLRMGPGNINVATDGQRTGMF